jgi:tRNA A37 threonylcarbamoyladenosine biosynthesis protein TsaE
VAGKLYHLDLWKIDHQVDFERLDIGSIFSPQTVVVIEWVQQVWPWLESVIASGGVEYLHLSFEQLSEHRKILIHE